MKNRILSIVFGSVACSSAATIGTWSASGGADPGADGWNVSTNGLGNAGSFQGNSANNGGGDVGSLTGDPAWGFYASNDGQSFGSYDLNGGALAVGQTLSINFDNGWVDTGGIVGIDFRMGTTSGLSLYFNAGATNYEVFRDGGVLDSGVGFTDDGFTINVTLTGANTFDLDFSTFSTSGTLGNGAAGIDNIQIFNVNAGDGSEYDVFANNITVVPEAHSALLGLAGATLLLRRRRA